MCSVQFWIDFQLKSFPNKTDFWNLGVKILILVYKYVCYKGNVCILSKFTQHVNIDKLDNKTMISKM